jgi:hypothetical protein
VLSAIKNIISCRKYNIIGTRILIISCCCAYMFSAPPWRKFYFPKKHSTLKLCIYNNIQQPPPLKGAFGALGVCVWPPSPPTNPRRKWKPLPLSLLLLLLSLLILLLHACASFARCLGAIARVCACACVCARLCARVLERECVCGVCMCVCARVCARCAPAHFRCCLRACLHPCQLHKLHNHKMPMQCQLYNPVGANKVCEFCMAASCSCAPLPLTQPGPLLPAAGGRGLGGEGQAKRGGASSPVVTSYNKYFLLPPP